MGAVTIPIMPDKLEAWKAWNAELVGPRKEEFEEFSRRMGLTRHRVWLMQSPMGAMAIVVHEGPGEATFLEETRTSDHPFDVWFRDNITQFHGIDFSQPLPGPPPELLLDMRTE